ncbi:UNVERIFIED_CONTAM: hypothetical protein RMT77_002125 [Armadillidium vulgare]
MINYNEEQSVVVESDEHTSVLLVAKATRKHSGNYTCVPSNAKPASILVHILTGEYPAAMQHGESSGKTLSPALLLLCCSILISFLLIPLNLSSGPQLYLKALTHQKEKNFQRVKTKRKIFKSSQIDSSPSRVDEEIFFNIWFSSQLKDIKFVKGFNEGKIIGKICLFSRLTLPQMWVSGSTQNCHCLELLCRIFFQFYHKFSPKKNFLFEYSIGSKFKIQN